MADNNKMNDATSSVETTDRGMFDFMKKKEDSKDVYKAPQEAHVISSGVEKCDEEKKHGGLLEKLHRSDSSSSSSSDEEGDDEEKKKKKKEKKDKKGGHKEEHHHEDTAVPIEKDAEEKKGGFLDKIKDKLHTETDTVAAPVQAGTEPCVEGDKEKKGFLDKIKEKIPGFHPKSDAHE